MELIVVGGGAAGFFCAVNAARMNPSLRVTIVEKSGKLLSKVRISGGGRCNVTHACFSISDILDRYPRGRNFVKKAFYEFFTTDTVAWFRERGLQLKAEPDGRMFPVTDSAESVIRCLLDEADRYRVDIRLNKDLRQLVQSGNSWTLVYADGSSSEAEAVCIACGGFPKLSQFAWLEKLGHSIEPPVPSLFTFNVPADPIRELMGVSAPASVSIAGTRLHEEGPVLITHWGLSGPAVLRLSARGARELAAMDYRFSAVVNWCRPSNEQQLKQTFAVMRATAGARKVKGRSPVELPQRLWDHLCACACISDTTRWGELTASMEKNLLKLLRAQTFHVEGKTTYKDEFVTAGGVRLAEIDPLTMQSRIAPGIYFAGEIMDVDGVTGGFNFQHAWTSGWIAARHIAGLSGTP